MAGMGFYQAPREWKPKALSLGARSQCLNVNSALSIVSTPSWRTWKGLYFLR
jgi:hypothetical protein